MSTVTPSSDAARPEISQQTPSSRTSEQDTLATTRQIVRACLRCRKQKARCDAFRPCSVCVKAGVECINRPANDKPDISSDDQNIRSTSAHPSEERPSKVQRTANTQSPRVREGNQRNSTNRTSRRSPSSEAQTRMPEENVEFMDLVEENMNTKLFTLTPGHLMEQSVPPQQPRDNNADSVLHLQHSLISGNESISTPSTSSMIDPLYRAVLPWSYSRATAVSLLVHLPPRPVTDYLIAVYFNTVHWFMVVLHEGQFLHHYRKMMDLYARDSKAVPNTDEDFTFVVLVLIVVALGGRYTSIHAARARRCKHIYMDFRRSSKPYGPSSIDGLDFDVANTTSQIFSVVRNNTTDNLACGTLATVQSLLLLGSLYLYHGEANLAWANSGSTVRAAHALGLHKEHSELRWSSPYYQRMDPTERRQLRWRLFWAVHTSDRFLSMCYGLPPLISDGDCVADLPCEDNVYPPPGCSSFLMVEDDLNYLPPASLSNNCGGPTTLLTYQTYKLLFYIILGQIISSLYRQSSGGCDTLVSRFENQAATGSRSSQSKTETLIETVQRLEAKLRNWYNDLPKTLRLSADMSFPGCNDFTDDDDDLIIIPAYDDLRRDSSEVQKRRSKIKNGIYGIQALLLQLAYDNALILIHRPILALKNSTRSTPSREVFSRSVDACWKASLRMSNIGKHHIFHRNQQAHAISYVGIHLFTAGVVLSVFGSSDPLSRGAWEAKQGLSRIIRMQRRLRKKVVVSGQGLTILENLAREVVRKEITTILAQDMDLPDDDEQAIPSEKRYSKESSVNDRMSIGAPLQATNLNEQTQFDLHPFIDTAASYTDVSPGWPMGGTSDLNLENDMLNESMLDIEKFLSDSQFLPTPEVGMNIDGSSTNNESQQPGIWWMSYE